MTWFAFQGLNGGKAVNLAGTQEKQAVIEGFHGYGTQAQAQAKPNSVNLLTRGLADTWIADYNAAVKEGAQPGGPNNILTPQGAAGAVGSTVPGLSQVGSFFSALSSKNLWIRLVKVVVGGTLLIVGLVHITGASGAAADYARKVPLPA